jgi:hypothetical protein
MRHHGRWPGRRCTRPDRAPRSRDGWRWDSPSDPRESPSTTCGVLHLEPEQEAVPARSGARIAQRRVLVGIPVMELEDERPARVEELLILGAAVTALAAEHVLVPAAARQYVSHGDQRLRVHRPSFPGPSWRGASSGCGASSGPTAPCWTASASTSPSASGSRHRSLRPLGVVATLPISARFSVLDPRELRRLGWVGQVQVHRLCFTPSGGRQAANRARSRAMTRAVAVAVAMIVPWESSSDASRNAMSPSR